MANNRSWAKAHLRQREKARRGGLAHLGPLGQRGVGWEITRWGRLDLLCYIARLLNARPCGTKRTPVFARCSRNRASSGASPARDAPPWTHVRKEMVGSRAVRSGRTIGSISGKLEGRQRSAMAATKREIREREGREKRRDGDLWGLLRRLAGWSHGDRGIGVLRSEWLEVLGSFSPVRSWRRERDGLDGLVGCYVRWREVAGWHRT